MKIGDLFYETWHALSANKGRSLLTILGIVIGIAAVIAMTSLIAGIQNTLMGEMGFEQARQVSISAYSPDGVTFDDLDKLERGMPEYEALTGAAYASAEITGADGQPVYMGITGVRPDYFGVMGSKLKEGRFFTDAENEGTDMDRLVETTQAYVAQYFNLDQESVYVQSLDAVIKQMETMMMSFSLLMGSVASISLFVGGIGIMNMMLTNVTERIREIGLRKSLGARRRDITKQFLLEAVMLCVAGGVFGIVFGFLAAWGLGQVIGAVQPGMTVTPVLAPGVVFGAVAVCVAIGVVFGSYPARRAAKLDPVESLRYQ